MRLRRALHNSPSSSLQLFDKLVAFNPREQSQAAALPLLELAASHSGNKGELLKAMAVCHILNRQYGLQQPPHKTPKDLAGTLRVLVGGEERWNAPIHFWRLGARALSSKAEFDTLAASKTQLAFILRLFSDADGEEKLHVLLAKKHTKREVLRVLLKRPADGGARVPQEGKGGGRWA